MVKYETTKQLIDEYFDTKSPEYAYKCKAQVDRPEVYEYEEKIGKKLVDMNEDELFEMMLTFRNGKAKKRSDGKPMSSRTFHQVSSQFRAIFNHYIHHGKVIINPWYSEKLRGMNMSRRISESKDRISFETIQKIIDDLHHAYPEEKAKYIECLIHLYYCGFVRPREIIEMREEDVDLKNKVVNLPEKTIHLTDRCCELLEYVHNMDDAVMFNEKSSMRPWRGSYFKFGIFSTRINEFDERDIDGVTAILRSAYHNAVKKELGYDISPRQIYMLGFYDYLVKCVGKERAHELATSVRDSETAEELMNHAGYYGIESPNVTNLKQALQPYL